MAAVYLIFTILSMFTCMLPAGVFSVIWESISNYLTVGVPSIAIIRVLIVIGVVAAAVLSDRIRSYGVIRDIVIGSTALEALALLGFSLSRVFWNLCVWSVCLGFGLGMGVTLLCRMLRRAGRRYAEIVFAGGALGITAGVWILSQVFARGGGWRTSCQILAVAQVLLCLLQFSLRRRGLRESEESVRKLQRERNRMRAVRRQKKIREDGPLDERSAPARFRSLACTYLACTFCSVLVLGAVLWPGTWLVSSGRGNLPSSVSVMIVSGGLAAGRLLAYVFPLPGNRKVLLFGVFAAAAAGVALVLSGSGLSLLQAEFLQFAIGAGAGEVLPVLITTEDERLDEDAQDSLYGLLPAFYAGALAVITPLTQALVGCGQERWFALWLLTAAVLMTLFLAGAERRIKR